MKGFASVLVAAALLLCLSSPAFAAETLEKPHAGQIISVNCQDDTDYRGDFYLSSLELLSREGNDLTLWFTGARIVLRDFFAAGEQRRFDFCDGKYVSGADFDAGGNFTGKYNSISSAAAQGSEGKLAAWLDPSIVPVYTVRLSVAGTEVKLNGTDIWGEDRKLCLDRLDALLGDTRPAWSESESLEISFERGAEGLTAVDAQLKTKNGLTLISSDAEVFCPISASALLPTGFGRTLLNICNRLGSTLGSFSVRSQAAGEAYALSCACPECGAEQAQGLHLLLCGHYSCTSAVSAAHELPECELAGHCVTDGLDHSRCRNCLQPQCDGQAHGVGLCEHRHNWVNGITIPATATTDGSTSAYCASCGYQYTQVIPHWG